MNNGAFTDDESSKPPPYPGETREIPPILPNQPPPSYHHFPNDNSSGPSSWNFEDVPVQLYLDENGQPVSLQPGVQVIYVESNGINQNYRNGDGTFRYERLDVPPDKLRCIALPLAILSLFFGSICCSIPAVIFSCKRNGTRSDYRTSIVLSCVALAVGMMAAVWIGIQCANYMSNHDGHL